MKRAGLTGAEITGAEITAAEYQDLLQRAAFAGVYGVVSTGIVCRAGCPARAPFARNVLVYPTAAAALAEGFRPCKRCGGGVTAASSGNSRSV